MYLSRIEIPWRTSRNPYRVHKDIWLLFPGMGSETRRNLGDERQGFLFRIEDNRLGRPARVLVQSRQVPVPSEKVAVLATREFNPQPREGQAVSFLLTANPIKTITDKEGRQNKKGETKKCRVPLIKEEHQKEWLMSRLRDAADVQAVKVRPLSQIFFLKKGETGKLTPVEFQGILRVKDPKAFIAILKNGIGPAKGFGCGLMLVRRI